MKRTPGWKTRIISSAQRLRCNGQQGQRIHEFEDEVAVAGGVDAVGGGCIEARVPQPWRGDRAARSRRQPRPSPADKDSAACGNLRAGRHRAKTFPHRQAANALPALVRRVADECRRAWPSFPASLCTIDKDADKIRQVSPQLIDRGPNIESEIGGDLLITAAAAVQLVAGVSDEGNELLLDEVMHVFGFVVFKKCWRSAARFAQSPSVLAGSQSVRSKTELPHSSGRWRARGWPQVPRSASAGRTRTTAASARKSGSSGCRKRPDHIFIATLRIS